MGQQSRDVVDRSLLAVDDSEAVGDEVVCQFGKLSGEGLPLAVVLRGLARVEAQVLEQENLTVGQFRCFGPCLLTDGVGGECDIEADRLRELGSQRMQ